MRGLGEFDWAELLAIVYVMRHHAAGVDGVLLRGVVLESSMVVLALACLSFQPLIVLIQVLLTVAQVLLRSLQLFLVLDLDVGFQVLFEVRSRDLMVLLLTQGLDVGVLVEDVLI